jgi:hypothetical protein
MIHFQIQENYNLCVFTNTYKLNRQDHLKFFQVNLIFFLILDNSYNKSVRNVLNPESSYTENERI